MDGEPTTKTTGTQVSGALRYVDRPECTETFADCILSSLFDGQTLRLEFGITRLDEIKQNTPVTGRRYPTCRLVLSPAAAMDLIKRTQVIASALTKAAGAKPAEKVGNP